MTITLYSSTADPRKINKLTELTQIEVIQNTKLLYPTTVLHPEFTLEYSAARLGANYCYISEFGRYYFLSEPSLGNGHTITFSCEVDVLTSFKTQIENLDVVCLRSQYDFDEYIADEIPSSVKATTTNYRFGSFSFGYPVNKSQMNYALVLNGLVGDP